MLKMMFNNLILLGESTNYNYLFEDNRKGSDVELDSIRYRTAVPLKVEVEDDRPELSKSSCSSSVPILCTAPTILTIYCTVNFGFIAYMVRNT